MEVQRLDVLNRSQEQEASEVKVQNGRMFPAAHARGDTIRIPVQDIQTVAGAVSPSRQGRDRGRPALLWWSKRETLLLLCAWGPMCQLGLGLCDGFLVTAADGEDEDDGAEVAEVRGEGFFHVERF